MIYLAQCIATLNKDNCASTVNALPSFFLWSKIQSITDAEQAKEIAKEIVNSLDLCGITVSIVITESMSLCEKVTFQCKEEEVEPLCAGSILVDADFLAEHGDPVCPRCDGDMEYFIQGQGRSRL